MNYPLSLPSVMERYSIFAAIIVGKNLLPHPPVQSLRKSLTAVVGNTLMAAIVIHES